MTETRFFEETGWPRRLDGEVIIEAGSGSGRFTEQALNTGATVLSVDYSRAVEANYRSNGTYDNLLLVQGDLFHMPFPDGLADRLFCFGVLQHTPDPRGALRSLVPHVRPGGEIVADIYPKTFVKYVLGTKYWVRPLTRRLSPRTLYRLTSRYVDLMWPVARRLRRIPKLGRALNWRLLIGDYSGDIADDLVLREWAKLDTFDMLAPEYDKPARLRSLQRWCEEMPVAGVQVHAGYNGYEIHFRRAVHGGGDGNRRETAVPRTPIGSPIDAG
jgi:SAM-dependent methyltransferase